MNTRRMGGLAFLLGLVAALPVSANVFTNVPEAADYTLVYTLPIPNQANFRNTNPIPYSEDYSASIGFYDRIAYYLELDTGTGLEYVYASMDSFNSNASQIGLPHNVNNPVIHQQIVSNMNVFSNKAGITTGTGITTGNIEFWSTNYNQSNAIGIPGASGTVFDFGDGGAGIGAGHGSFQVHNYGAGETLIGYSDWGGNNAGGNSELGIGTNTGTVQTPSGPVNVGGHPDWTFADTAHLYTVKNLQILVHEAEPPPLPVAPAHIIANAPEAAGYGLVYQLPIQNGAFSPAQYVVDNSALIPNGSFERVAYYLELQSVGAGSQFLWVSMDTFTDDASLLGVPNTAAAIQQTLVSDMNVISDVPAVTNLMGVDGNIEFWNTNYTGAPSGIVPGGAGNYDFDDTPTPGGYGSMQIHSWTVGEVLLAYNHWNGGTPDLGIGNDPLTTRGNYNPDWTFASQTTGAGADQYTLKNLYVLIDVPQAPLIPEPGTLALVGAGLAVLGRRRRTTSTER